MAGEWKPSAFHDTSREVLMKIIEAKIEKGETEHVEEKPAEKEERTTVNFMDALKKSLRHGSATSTAKARAGSRRSRRTRRKAG